MIEDELGVRTFPFVHPIMMSTTFFIPNVLQSDDLGEQRNVISNARTGGYSFPGHNRHAQWKQLLLEQ